MPANGLAVRIGSLPVFGQCVTTFQAKSHDFNSAGIFKSFIVGGLGPKFRS